MAVAVLLAASAAQAAPNVSLDDTDWILLRDARARGLIPDLLGGQQALGEDEVQRALARAGLMPDPHLLPPDQTGFWLRPLETLTLRGDAFLEHDRPYSLPARPRNIEGVVGFSCELQEGRPCGGGLGLLPELDSSAGLGSWLSASTRVRVDLGNNRYAPGAQFDRGYLKAQLGPLAIEAGRDVLALGPSDRSAILLSRNAAPLDQLRAWTRPFALPYLTGDILRVSFLYFIARLRQPQFYDGTYIDCTRMQLDLFNRIQLGGSRLLQFGGNGAPTVGVDDFIAEHFARKYDAAGRPLGDNRLALDLSVAIPELYGSRLYSEFTFEDFRRQELNVFQYDTDYLVGFEARALERGPLKRVLAEAAKTGRLSQEGLSWLSGWTNAGHTLGSPLGPDGLSLYTRVDFEWAATRLSPWAEVLRFSSDTFKDDGGGDGGVQVDKAGPAERRQRAGLEISLPLTRSFLFEANGYLERVTTADLLPGATRFNAGLSATLRYLPAFASR